MSTSPTFDAHQATALAQLISSSVQTLVSASDVKSNGIPNRHGHADAAVAARLATLQIVSAASQLVALVRPPEQYLMDAATGFHLPATLRLVVETHVVEIIREKGNTTTGALHVKDISAMNGVNAYKLARILRLLATHHIFVEVAPDTFANNALSSALDTGKALTDILAHPEEKYDGSSGLAALIALTADESMRNGTFLTEALTDPATRDSFAPLAAPFSRAWPGAEKLTMFDWMNLPENKPRLMRFGNAMKGMSGMTPEDAILRGFDWTALPPESVVIDVGGGVGAASLPIVKSCPNIKLVLQDTEPVVEQAPKFWQSHLPEALETGRVSFQVQDFFHPQPASSSNASVFLLRMIMHNWPDAECERILAHVRAAAEGCKEDVKLVVVDSILMYACRGGAVEGEGEEGVKDLSGEDALAPEPLLANWGSANALAYKLDIQMLNNHNAGERTLGEFVKLLARTGWKAVEVHAAHQSWMPQIVAVPVAIPFTAVPTSTTTAPEPRPGPEVTETRPKPDPQPEPQAAEPKPEVLKVETKVNGMNGTNGVTRDVSAQASPIATSPAAESVTSTDGENEKKEKKKSRRRSLWKGLGFAK